ncbi:unnamed protein product [Jaminaea pallidilutea]
MLARSRSLSRLALLLLLAWTILCAHCTAAVDLPATHFKNYDATISALRRRLASSSSVVDAPFANGCVGTATLCQLARSRAQTSEKQTLRHGQPPGLWRVAEDEAFERAMAEASPSLRLHMYYKRLGGEDYRRKRNMPQSELQRQLHESERLHEAERQANLKALQAIEEAKAAEDRRSKQRLGATIGKDSLQGPQQTQFSSSASSSSTASSTHDGGAHERRNHRRSLSRRSLSEADSSSSDETAESSHDKSETDEHDAFHAALRNRFSRPGTA